MFKAALQTNRPIDTWAVMEIMGGNRRKKEQGGG